jgi:hypothetical protein
MTISTRGSSLLKFFAATALVLAMTLMVLHGCVPHDSAQGTCVACQTLSAPALMPLAEAPGLPAEWRAFLAIPRSDGPIASSAPRLRPLRAPPLSLAA